MTGSLFPVYLGVFLGIVVLIVPAAWVLRRASRGFDPPLSDPQRRFLAAKVTDISEREAAARWQYCDWCDPAGTQRRRDRTGDSRAARRAGQGGP